MTIKQDIVLDDVTRHLMSKGVTIHTLREVVARSMGIIISLLRPYGLTADAEQVAGNVLTTVAGVLHKWDRGQLQGFVNGVAKNVTYQWIDKQMKSADQLPEETDYHPIDTSLVDWSDPLEILVDEYFHNSLMSAIEHHLGQRAFRIFYHRFVNDISEEDLARAENLSTRQIRHLNKTSKEIARVIAVAMTTRGGMKPFETAKQLVVENSAEWCGQIISENLKSGIQVAEAQSVSQDTGKRRLSGARHLLAIALTYIQLERTEDVS